ncbi:MAG: hypothetical protein WCD18_19030, partial [Thermosynechococcaceae cyanobacterium]
MHLALKPKTKTQPRKRRKPLVAIAATVILAAMPLSAKAFDFSFLNDILAQLDEVFGIDSGQWLQEAIDVVNQISGSHSGNFDLDSLLNELMKEIQGEMGLPDPTEIGTTDSGNTQRNEEVGIPSDVKYPEQA